jgi:hypothetical protein
VGNYIHQYMRTHGFADASPRGRGAAAQPSAPRGAGGEEDEAEDEAELLDADALEAAMQAQSADA